MIVIVNLLYFFEEEVISYIEECHIEAGVFELVDMLLECVLGILRISDISEFDDGDE